MTDTIIDSKEELVVIKEDNSKSITVPITESITVESTKTESVLTGTLADAVTNSETYNVVVEIENTNTIITGIPGPPGISEENIVYAKQVDFVTDDLFYKGEAAVGSLLSDPAWRIRKITIGIDGDVSETWAAGNAIFDKVWDNRVSLNYS